MRGARTTRTRRTWCVGAAAAVSLGVVLLAHAEPVVLGKEQVEACSAAAYGRALSVDERSLTSRSVELTGRSAEGSTLTVLRHESTPRLLRISDLGETGRAITTIYLVDSLTFVAWRTEHRYSRSIGADPQARIARSETSVRFACRGSWYGGEGIDTSDAADLVRMAYRHGIDEQR